MIYFQNIDYNVYLMATTWDGDQLYTIIVNTTIKPATQIDSSFWNGIENSTYQHVVAIRGAETNYYNLFPNSDTFLSMAPNSNYTNIKDGDTISAVLYCPTAYDFSYNFDVSTNEATKINMTASYSSSETCTIKFMTEKNFSLLGQVPNLSSEDFSYKSGIYMQSGGTILWIDVRMGVGYAFVNEDKETKHWVYGTKEIYYESE